MEELGSEAFVHVTITHQGQPTVVVVRAPGETSIARGDNVHVGFAGQTHVFADSGHRVGS